VAAVGVIVVLLVAAACGSADDDAGDADPYDWVVAGLCRSAAEAGDGSVETARDTFFDTAHQGLHELADEVSDIDRAVAAALLQAKEAVEAGFTDGAEDIPTRLGALVAATDRALVVTQQGEAPCHPYASTRAP
jgi:hypothetical protein